jgi:hypothetical protein
MENHQNIEILTINFTLFTMKLIEDCLNEGDMIHMEEKDDTKKGKADCTDKAAGNRKGMAKNSPAGAVYGLGFIGAAIYYISMATTFWAGVLGFLKAVVWPVFLVYEALAFLGK